MNASAFRDIWARVMFFKFENLKNITQWLPNCSHVLFQPINYNLVTGKPSVNFFLANVLNRLIKFLYFRA